MQDDVETVALQLYDNFWQRNHKANAQPFSDQATAIREMWTSIAADALSAATPVIEARVREEMKREAEPRKQFPILGSQGAKIDWQLVADHGKQARVNHYQTVERLAERGGLAWSELYAVLHDKPWQKIDENGAIRACRALEAAYLDAAIRKG